MNKSSLLFLLLIFCMQISPSQATNVDDAWLFNRQGLFKASQGDHAGAIKDFEKACRLNPFDDNALANLACARNNLGVILANQKNYTEAIRHFNAAKAQKPEDISIRLNLLSTLVTVKDAAAIEREAAEIIALRPNDVETVLKVAAAFQNSENALAAQTTLEALADRVPDEGRVHETLGRLLYRSGDLSEAEYHLNRAHNLDRAGNEKARALLEQIRRENQVNQHSHSYSSIHFALTCHESFSEEWAEGLLELLEEAYEQIGEKLNFYPSQRSQVLVFQTEDFRNVHDLPEWAGGVYDGKIRLPVPGSSVNPDFLRNAIRHEYTHHVVFLLARGNCPIWLNEGLAQIFEFDSEISSVDAGFNPEVEMLQDFANAVRSAQSRRQVAAIYRNAHLTTLKMVAEAGWASLAEILEKMGKGFAFEQAGKEILGYLPINLQQEK
jgi:tetratricopeptide (TPR) repeat protein